MKVIHSERTDDMTSIEQILPPDIGVIQQNDGDYRDNEGMLRCGVCHERKERILPPSLLTGWKEKRVRCICQCQVKEMERKAEEERQREIMERIEELKSSSLMDSKLKDVRLKDFEKDEDNEKIYRLVSEYVKRFDEMYKKHQGILFCGEVGTGKSFAAACIANELLDRRIPVIMTSFVKILQVVQGYQEEETNLVNRFNEARLLIIDDLGAERTTSYALEKVYNVIDSRYRSGKPLILTTNMSIKEMQENTDMSYKRIYDRIFEMCFPVRVQGRSWREKEAEKRFDEMKKLMEG